MKLIYQKLTGCPEEGFVVKEVHGEACNCPWHCHAEVELVLTLQSRGYRIVGDDIQPLIHGDLVLLGANLPHCYQHVDRLRTSSESPAHCLLLQFEERLWSHFFELPAMAPIRRLLERAANGLHVTGPTRSKVATMLSEMSKLRGIRRINMFLTVLHTLAQSRNCRTISGPGLSTTPTSHEQERIGRVCQFIDENCHRPLRIVEAARFVHMSEGAFSRFFRSHMGKTFPAFVNDLRIGRACRLLIDTEVNITEIALGCGYPNLSNFNRQFLHFKKLSPGEFRKKMQRHS